MTHQDTEIHSPRDSLIVGIQSTHACHVQDQTNQSI